MNRLHGDRLLVLLQKLDDQLGRLEARLRFADRESFHGRHRPDRDDQRQLPEFGVLRAHRRAVGVEHGDHVPGFDVARELLGGGFGDGEVLAEDRARIGLGQSDHLRNVQELRAERHEQLHGRTASHLLARLGVGPRDLAFRHDGIVALCELDLESGVFEPLGSDIAVSDTQR
jgi:hypothetical protein